MASFFSILQNNILPIFILIGLGALLKKIFPLDIATLSKFNLYLLMPSVVFVKLYQSEVSADLFKTVFIYYTLLFLLMMAAGHIISRLLGYSRGMASAFSNSLLFMNSGNYGIPLIELVFQHNPQAITIQALFIMLMDITVNTIGIFQASIGKSSIKKALRNVLKMPSIYAVPLALFLNYFRIPIWQPLWTPVKYLSDALVAMALMTLGAQLVSTQISGKAAPVLLNTMLRLLGAPAVGFILIYIMGIQGLPAQVLLVASSVPTAVNVALIALEFDNEPEFASQTVFLSTLMSAVTVSVVIYFATTFIN